MAVLGPSLGVVVVVGVEEPREDDQAKKAAVLLTLSAENQGFLPLRIFGERRIPGNSTAIDYMVEEC